MKAVLMTQFHCASAQDFQHIDAPKGVAFGALELNMLRMSVRVVWPLSMDKIKLS